MPTNNMSTASMLVCVDSGLPRQVTALKEEAAAIERSKGALRGTVRSSVYYFKRDADKAQGEKGKQVDGLQSLKEFITEYKEAVFTRARYPYIGGMRLVPAPLVDEVLEVKAKYDKMKQDVWYEWANNVYPIWYDSAAERMGSMFSDQDFPSLSESMQRFTCTCDLAPLAEAEAVKRITLISRNSQEMLERMANARNEQQHREMVTSIWKDLMGPIQHVVDTFEKDAPKIYETMLSNLMKIVNVVPSYSELVQDEKLQEAAAKAKEVFGRMSTADLKKSDEARVLAFTTAKDLVTTFSPYARKFAD